MNNKINNSNLDSKSNLLRLSTSTSLQSLEIKAARAALIARMEQGLRRAESQPSQRPQKRAKQRNLSQLERELKTIRSTFERAELDHTEVTFENPTSGSSAVCVIKTALKVKPQSENPLDKDEQNEGGQDMTSLKEETKRTYVFYPSTTDPNRLGSVAIYGTNVASELSSLRRKGSIFGIKIDAVSIEIGRRPFLDVTFRA